MNADNFVKECHLLAEDAKLVSKDKNDNVMLPASFFGELSGILRELGVTPICPFSKNCLNDEREEQEHE